MGSKFFHNFKRVSFDFLILVGLCLLMFFIPDTTFNIENKLGLASLVITKFLLVSAGVVHAHIVRKLLFPYISFKDEKDWSNNAMIIAIYVVVIFGWTRGG